MPTKTKADLVTRVLDKLQRTAAGQNPAPEDVTLVSDNLSTILAALAADEIVYVANVDQIDEAIFQALAMCVADKVAGDFGTVIDQADLVSAESFLKRITVLRPIYTPQNVSYI